MERRPGRLGIALALALSAPAPAVGQVWFSTDALLPGPAEVSGATWVEGGYTRGLNDASGETDVFTAGLGRGGARASVVGRIGYITDGDGEFSLGFASAVDLTGGDGPRVALQGGVGWMSPGSLTFLRFPVGLALAGDLASGPSVVTGWVMPRADISRFSGFGDSETETDFGVSGGVRGWTATGTGIEATLDLLTGEGVEVWRLSFAIQRRLG